MAANKPILGISISTRMIGLGVIEGHSLLDYSIKLFKERWSETKLQAMLTSLHSCIKDFNIQSIALSSPYEIHQTKEYVELVSRISVLCREKNIPFETYPIREVLSTFKITQKEKKKPLQEALILMYPELEKVKRKITSQKQRYYDKLFEAVGVGLLHSFCGE